MDTGQFSRPNENWSLKGVIFLVMVTFVLMLFMVSYQTPNLVPEGPAFRSADRTGNRGNAKHLNLHTKDKSEVEKSVKMTKQTDSDKDEREETDSEPTRLVEDTNQHGSDSGSNSGVEENKQGKFDSHPSRPAENMHHSSDSESSSGDKTKHSGVGRNAQRETDPQPTRPMENTHQSSDSESVSDNQTKHPPVGGNMQGKTSSQPTRPTENTHQGSDLEPISDNQTKDSAVGGNIQGKTSSQPTRPSGNTQRSNPDSNPGNQTKQMDISQTKATAEAKSSASPASAIQSTTQPSIERCDKECLALKDYLKTWPQDRVKGAVYYLMRMSPFNVRRLKLSLKALELFVLKKFHYPVIIFHEEDFIPVIEDIRSSVSSSPVFFQQVNFEMPPFIKDPVPQRIDGCPRDISYRHMCRFQSKLVYEEPITEVLDYMWRLDDDSYILAPIHFDIFDFMQSREIDYGYIVIGSEIERCIVGLWEAVEDFVEHNALATEFYQKWRYPAYYYNNFEISKRSIWASPKYKKYINYIDRQGGIYYHRWGDAPIKSLAVTLLVPENRTFSFQGLIKYQHSVYGLPDDFLKQVGGNHP